MKDLRFSLLLFYFVWLLWDWIELFYILTRLLYQPLVALVKKSSTIYSISHL
jgi:hypothetical protein